MSGIFGVVRFDGAPVRADEVDAMRAAMSHWGCGDQASWLGPGVGLGGAVDNGRFAFTGQGRLDNREDLQVTLDLPAESRHWSDVELMRLAYERWGSECPARLIGDWSLAAWDHRRRQLCLARDQFGNTSLYYVADERQVAFASDRRALFALSGVSRKINELYLAQVLASWNAYQGESTAYTHLHRLPPAQVLVASADSIRIRSYWNLDAAPEIRLPTVAAYAEGVFEQLERAIDVRLRSPRPAVVSLSAGLDSGAIAVIAGRILRAQGRGLLALTAAPAYEVSRPDTICDEFTLASLTADAAGARHLRIESRGVSPIGGIERMLEIHGAPGHSPANYHWLLSILAEAHGGVMLTGQMGNYALSRSVPPRWSDVFAIGADEGLALGARLAVARARAAGSAVYRGLLRAGRVSEVQPWIAYSAISREFSERVDLARRMAEAGHDPNFGRPNISDRALRARHLRIGRDALGAVWAELGAATGVVAADPSRDIRLLSFMHGIPHRFQVGTPDRRLIREAMRGVLPEAIRTGTVRGQQGSDVVRRLRATSSQLRSAVDEITDSSAASAVVDAPRLRRLAVSVASGAQVSHEEACAVLLRGVGVGLFAARHL